MATPTAAEIVRLLVLKPHPEGGHFRETFRDGAATGARATSTAIYSPTATTSAADLPRLPGEPERLGDRVRGVVRVEAVQEPHALLREGKRINFPNQKGQDILLRRQLFVPMQFEDFGKKANTMFFWMANTPS